MIYDPNLTSAEFRVCVAIMSFGFGNNPSFPSQVVLSEKIGISTRAIRHHSKSLKEKGYLKYKRRGFNKSNVYIVLTDGKKSSSMIGRHLPDNNTNNNTSNNVGDIEKRRGMESLKETLTRKGIIK